jgi:hypothetical protein
MLNQAPSFEDYILQIARPRKNSERAACLRWLRERSLMGLLPRMTLQSGVGTWSQFYKLMPEEHREAAGKLWREYVSYRAYHRRKKVRLRGKAKRMHARRWTV